MIYLGLIIAALFIEIISNYTTEAGWYDRNSMST